MTQIKAAPLRAAKSAKAIAKKRDILKVKSAIRYHERAREQRRTLRHAQYMARQLKQNISHAEHAERRRTKEAMAMVREDWKLGPLRPHRSPVDDLYGSLDGAAISPIHFPKEVVKREDERRERTGLEPKYPFIVDGKRYFPIVEGDRVVVTEGREKGKIGTVKEVAARYHQVIIKDVNMHLTDSALYSLYPEKPTVDLPVPISMDHVRLVIPYRITTAAGRHIYQDVMVDNVAMERHTTGIDPFTGIDHGAEEFPVEHRFDPETELPVFKRYIAGTRSVIPWPWEKDEQKLKAKEPSTESTPEEKPGILTRIRRLPNSLRERITARRNAAAKAEEERQARENEELSLIDSEMATVQQGVAPSSARSKPVGNPVTHEGDTARNRSDVTDETLRSFFPTLKYPPHPHELSTELAASIKEKHKEALEAAMKRNSDVREDGAGARERKLTAKEIRKNEKKIKAMEAMKTPLQLRWEVTRAQQAAQTPKVDTEQLLIALGKHMESNGVQFNRQRKAVANSVQQQMDVD
ncbi:unnamed protein product [Periconia digitata]|uniref:KOW domain-containing protein n=1 Tax=Periconia digitata TaxID=1303443 RepID=A0A9W4XNI9_9PLEO|nr:unnamed protein product [Periconia digitata]